MDDSVQCPNLKFLFVTGCPRSGTTEVVNVLNHHPAVAIGMERFKFVIRDRFEDFQQCLFETENFVRSAEEDTNILPRSPAYRAHYAMLKNKLEAGGVTYVGDKLPFLHRHYQAINKRFESPRWLIMHRSPYAVAASYCLRARDPDDKGWPEQNDHTVAVKHWVESFRLMRSMEKELPERALVCQYEEFYSGDRSHLARVFDFLGLTITPEVEAYFRETTADWDRRVRRGFELSPDEIADIDSYLAREESIVMTSPSAIKDTANP